MNRRNILVAAVAASVVPLAVSEVVDRDEARRRLVRQMLASGDCKGIVGAWLAIHCATPDIRAEAMTMLDAGATVEELREHVDAREAAQGGAE